MASPAPPASAFTLRRGVVEAFDDHVGSGTLRDLDDHRAWWFHCTRIAGATRTVAVGASVSFVVRPGPTGLEAVDVDPVA